MINLLPTSTRENMLYARRNSVLLRWLFGLIIAMVGVSLIIASGMFYLTETTKSFEERTAEGKASLQAQDIDGTQAKVEEISSNVKLTTDVLSKEILFSKLIKQIGATLPANTALQQLQITDLRGSVTLRALAIDFNSATQVQINLEDKSNKVFEKADIENIDCEPEPSTGIYPCLVQVKALFAQDNPFLYIEQNTGGSGS